MYNNVYDVIVIGAGVVGASISRELSKYDLSVLVIEKNNDVGSETTKANSAIVHAGFDAKEGSLMAKLNVLGNAMFDALSNELDFPFKRNGSLVIAITEEEKIALEDLYKRGIKNGVPNLKVLSKEEVINIEPNINNDIYSALYAGTGGIVGPWEMAVALCENASENGVEFKLGEEVINIDKNNEENIFYINTNKNEYSSKIIVNCTGVNTDDVHNMVCDQSFKINARKGEYIVLNKFEGGKIKHTIFQAPSKMGKGILITPTVHGNLLVGPDAEDIDNKIDKSTVIDRLNMIKEVSKKSSDVIDFTQQIRQFSGLRAESDRGDFVIEEDKNVKSFIDVSGIKSPGLTAAPAIALEVLEIIKNIRKLSVKDTFNPIRKKHIIFSELSFDDKNKLITENPLYGKIVCKCENISEAEVIDVIKRHVGATTVDGVKRRCRPGMGACQGGFCGPKIQEILSSQLNKNMNEIILDYDNSYILTEETKKLV